MKINGITLARIGSAITLGAIAVGATFGRVLSNTYPLLVDIIPYLGGAIGIIVITAAAINRWGSLTLDSSIANKKKFAYRLTACMLTIILACTACELLISFPIERVHFVKYGTLAFLLFFSFTSNNNYRRFVENTLLTSLVGLLEECIQIWIPDRVFDYRDIVLNILASFFGSLLAVSVKEQRQSA